MNRKSKIKWFIILGILFTIILVSIFLFYNQSRSKIRNRNDYAPTDLAGGTEIGNIDNYTPIDNFYISNGITSVIDNFVFLSVTLNNNEHKLLKINVSNNTSEVLYTDYNSYPIDFISTMNHEIYLLSRNLNDYGIQKSYIRKFNQKTQNMDICIEKSLNKNEGEYIKAFSSNHKDLYAVIDVIKKVFFAIPKCNKVQRKNVTP